MLNMTKVFAFLFCINIMKTIKNEFSSQAYASSRIITLLIMLLNICDAANSLTFTKNTTNYKNSTSSKGPQRNANLISNSKGPSTKTGSLHLNHKVSFLREKCLKSEKELDSCSSQLLAFGLNEATYPNNIDQLDSDYCPKFRKLVTCIKDSTECYRPFEKQIIK